MSKANAPVPSSRALPASVTELQAQRIVTRTITLLDEVEQALLAAFDDLDFKKYRDALEAEDAVEGSIFADDICAAQMIRKKAIDLNLQQVEKANLTVISHKLRAAEARFNASRKQRAKATEAVAG